MAVLRCSAMFLTWLLFMTVLISSKGNSGLDKKVCSFVVVKGLDVNHYPTPNSGPTRRYVRVAVLPPALKCLAGLRLANITLCASYLVLLAGDIQQNPGPAKNYSCSKRRRNETCAGQTVKCGSCTKSCEEKSKEGVVLVMPQDLSFKMLWLGCRWISLQFMLPFQQRRAR